LLVVTALVALFVNISPDGDLNSTIQSVQTSVTTIAYAGEISEIQKAVEEFFILRTIHDKEERQLFASKIDERLNKLQLVKIYCDKEISTLELVNEKKSLYQITRNMSSYEKRFIFKSFRII